MTVPIESKLPDVGTTIFTVMSQLAADTGAINLAQGFPSFDPPDELTDRITWHLKHGANQYAPMPGVPALREAIAAKTRRLQHRGIDPETEITISTGATEGLFSTIHAVIRPGDEAIIFDPAFDSYEPAVTLAGGATRHVPLRIAANGHDFEMDWQRLADTITPKTRLVIVNFPHNPTGAILSRADLDRLAELIRPTGAYLLADEVYEHIVFDGLAHHSVLSHPELWERSFVVSSFGKTFHSTGWKIGYCIAPAPLSEEFRRVHQYTTFSVSTPMQHALADYMAENPTAFDRLPVFYQQKRSLFCKLLGETRFQLLPARSTFFQVADYSEISDADDVTVSEQWTRDVGVASIPLSVFCETPFTGKRLRFCFAKDDATLTEAARRLAQL